MKDALMKAGVISKESLRKEELNTKGPQQKGVHEHHMNTFCTECNKSSEDVEYYEHTNRILRSKWLCLVCADKNWIHDDSRQTQQSTAARSGRFQRFYGPTKRFAAGQGLTAPSGIKTQGKKNENSGNRQQTNSRPPNPYPRKK